MASVSKNNTWESGSLVLVCTPWANALTTELHLAPSQRNNELYTNRSWPRCRRTARGSRGPWCWCARPGCAEGTPSVWWGRSCGPAPAAAAGVAAVSAERGSWRWPGSDAWTPAPGWCWGSWGSPWGWRSRHSCWESPRQWYREQHGPSVLKTRQYVLMIKYHVLMYFNNELP